MVASPYAKKLAREAGVDISQATATGSEGRIVAADVQKLISEGGGKAKDGGQQPAAAPGPEQSGKAMLLPCVYRTTAVCVSWLCGHLSVGLCLLHGSVGTCRLACACFMELAIHLCC